MTGRKLAVSLAGAALALAMAWASAAAAAPPTAPELPDVTPEQSMLASVGGGVQAQITSTGDPDEDAVLAAVADVHQSGILAVKDHEAALRQVLADMPQPFVRMQTVNGVVVFRADAMTDCIVFATQHPQGPRGHFICKGNPFASAGFYLGAYLNEVHRPADALPMLELGLLAGPNSPLLITEHNASLMALGGPWDEILAGVEHGLAIPNLAPRDRARLLRNRGYALVELKRLDEAQQAYESSLTYDPQNPLAPNELRYIAQLRAGAAATPGVMVKSGEAPK